MATRNQRRLERQKLIKEFSPRFWDDPEIAELPVIRKLKKRYLKLVEECQAEHSPSRKMLCWKAVFFDVHLDTSIINALTQDENLDVGVVGQGMNVLIGLLRSLTLGANKSKGKVVQGKVVSLTDYKRRKAG